MCIAMADDIVHELERTHIALANVRHIALANERWKLTA